MIDLIFYVLAFFGLILGTIEDVRIREVPDTVNYFMICVGILGGLALAIFENNISLFLNHIFGFLLGLVIGVILYALGQWGGGDAKALMGVGSLVGLNIFGILSEEFLLSFIVSIFLVGSIWGFIWMLVLALRNWKNFTKEYTRLRKQNMFLKHDFLFFSIILVIAVLVIFLVSDLFIKSLLLLIFFLIYSMIFLSVFAKSVEKTCMIKKIPVDKLVEGDWVVGKVKLKDGSKFSCKKTGLNAKNIVLLKKNVKSVLIKDGIPFLPSFLIAFIICAFLGSWISLLFLV